MNIFTTSYDPKECAKYLDDKRVVKMALESCQLLSNAMHLNNNVGPYKLTHAKHPCTLWAAHCRRNYGWLLNHFKALLSEYKARYGREHKCGQYMSTFESFHDYMPLKTRVLRFVNCTTDYKHIEDTILAYQMQLNDKWDTDKRVPTWYKIAK